MATKYPALMSDKEIIAFFNKFDTGSTPDEVGYLEGYRSAPDKSLYLLSLLDDAVEKGTELKSHTFIFDPEDNPYLAEICPDGESGFVALDKFFGLFFVRYVLYGEGGENFGPWANMNDATLAFKIAVFEYDPG